MNAKSLGGMTTCLGFGFWMLAALLAFGAMPAHAAPNPAYVDAAASTDSTQWLGTAAKPFKTIGYALAHVDLGTEVIVARGTYTENVSIPKNVVLRSTNPHSLDTITSTVIRGHINFSGTESAACVLSGFTITGGVAPQGGGISGNGTHTTIQNNIITGNQAISRKLGGWVVVSGPFGAAMIPTQIDATGFGGGLANCDGLIQNNIIMNNQSGGAYPAGYSGKPYGSPAPTQHYSADFHGAALYDCNGTIRNNLIDANSITATAISGPLTTWVNLSLNPGTLEQCAGLIQNNIIWNNHFSYPNASPVDLKNCSGPTYCDIQYWTGDGTGNISQDPLFVDAAGGDFRLQALSPCIDAGMAVGGQDIIGTPRPVVSYTGTRGDGSHTDMGAYEYPSMLSIVRGWSIWE